MMPTHAIFQDSGRRTAPSRDEKPNPGFAPCTKGTPYTNCKTSGQLPQRVVYACWRHEVIVSSCYSQLAVHSPVS